MIGARDDAGGGFERLAQSVERLRRKFRKFVEKEHAVMGERRLSRFRAEAAADQRRHGGGMVRRTEGPAVRELAARQLPGDRMDHRDFEQFGGRKRRQDGGEPRRKHRLAGTGRADHQQIMVARRRDLQRPLGAFLALDVGKIGKAPGGRPDRRLGAGKHLRAAEMIGDRDQAARGENIDLRSGPGRLGPAFRRADQPLAERIRADRRRQRAGDGCDRAVEIELADDDITGQRVRRDSAERRHQAERDGEIEMASLFRKVRRRQIDGHPLGGKRQPRCMKRRLDALAAFGHRLVRQSDDLHTDLAGCNHHLDVDRNALDTLKRNRADARDHTAP